MSALLTTFQESSAQTQIDAPIAFEVDPELAGRLRAARAIRASRDRSAAPKSLQVGAVAPAPKVPFERVDLVMPQEPVDLGAIADALEAANPRPTKAVIAERVSVDVALVEEMRSLVMESLAYVDEMPDPLAIEVINIEFGQENRTTENVTTMARTADAFLASDDPGAGFVSSYEVRERTITLRDTPQLRKQKFGG